ncbi:hypothetical protein ACLB1T_26155 [Escherichia coli]
MVIVPVEGRFQEARLMDMSHDLTLSGWAMGIAPTAVSSVTELRGNSFADQPRPLVRSEIRQRIA